VVVKVMDQFLFLIIFLINLATSFYDKKHFI
jgi:hypothetical protein